MEYSIDQQLRIQALSSAVGHRLGSETAEDVVNAAEKYYTFLRTSPPKPDINPDPGR